MNYETFKNIIRERLEYDIPNPKTISIEPILKNNGLTLDGLVIMENGTNISPTIYLNYYYESYQSGTTFHNVYLSILDSYHQNRSARKIDIRFFTDLEQIRPRIVFKLIHYQRNLTLLSDIPHIPFLDLAIVFYCLVNMEEENTNASILIRNSHLSYWNLTTRDLFAIAQENTPRLLPHELHNMKDLLSDMDLQDCDPDKPVYDAEHNSYPMFILTNNRQLYGAACLLYPDLLAAYAERSGTDFYILPSSVHEVLLLPAIEENCLEELSAMVKEVNATQLLPDEILADHAYFYSAKAGKILM